MEELSQIIERNNRVETDKAWETSWTRRLIISVVTYVVAVFYMTLLNVPLPWLSAVVPVGGFLFSTLSLPFAKKYWLRYIYHRTLP